MRLFLSFAGLFCTLSFYAQLNFSNLTAQPETNAQLRYAVNFNTSEPAHAFVEWQRVSGFGSGEIKRSDVSGLGTAHEFKLIELAPESEYQYRIHAWNNGAWNSTDWMSFTTTQLPTGQPYADSVSVVNPNLTGYFMTNSVGVADSRIQIYNRAGEVVWYEYHSGQPVNGQTIQCRFYNHTEEGNLLVTECHELTERDLYGNIIAHVDFNGTPYENLFFHHDARKRNGHYFVIGAELRYFDFSSIGGSSNQGVIGEHILEFDAEGNVYSDWTNFDHFDPLTAVNTNAYWNPVFGAGNYNWWHTNSLDFDYDGNYLISCKEIDQMMKIDATTGELIWSLSGNNATIPFDDGITQTGDQHDLNDVAPGKYIVFDNTGLINQSRLLEYEIVDYTQPTAFKSWEYVLPTQWFSNILGTARRMPGSGPNPNRYFVAGNKRILGEVNHTGDIQWLIRQSTWIYRTYYYEQLVKNAPVEVLVNGTPGICAGEQLNLQEVVNAPGEVYFTGNAVSNGVFDAQSAGTGLHQVHYQFANVEGDFNVQVYPTQVSNTVIAICNGDSLLINGTWQYDPGFFVVYGVDNNGCQSVTNLNLIVTADEVPAINPAIIMDPNCAGTWTCTVPADSYNWMLNGTLYTNQPQTVDPTAVAGSLVVEGSVQYVSGSCLSDWSATAISDCTVGIGELDTEAYQIYPNPVNEFLQIRHNGKAIGRISIYDFTGRLVMNFVTQATESRISTSDWAKGLYTIALEDSEGNLRAIRVVKD